MQGKKRQFIFGLIGLGCGIVLSGILNLLLLLNTTEYKNGITLNASLMTQSIVEDENKSAEAGMRAEQKSAADESAQNKEVINTETNEEKIESQEAATDGKPSEKMETNVAVEETADREVTVTIPPKMTASDTCEILEAAGVINDAKDFRNYISERKKTTKLNEGTFVLSKNMSYNELLDKLMID